MIRKSSGFTMIELMAVVVIVAVLSAMIGLALWDAKAAAKKSTCAFNLRQMGIGLISYVQDYDGQYPQTKAYTTQQPQLDDASGSVELPDFGSPLSRLGPYSTGLTECPADTDPYGDVCTNVPDARPGVNSYLANGFFVWGLNECQVDGDAHTVYLAERRGNVVGTVPPNCDVIFHPW